MDKQSLSEIRQEYFEILKDLKSIQIYEEATNLLMQRFRAFWVDNYTKQSDRLTSLCSISHGSFEFVYDDTDALIDRGILPEDTNIQSRIVVAYGTSTPQTFDRDDYRLRGWVGPTEKIFGKIGIKVILLLIPLVVL